MSNKDTGPDSQTTGQHPAGESDEPRYQWPPVRDPDLSYKAKSRNPVHSIITALPLIMLAVGLTIYYVSESRQTHSAPIRAESIDISGTFTGFSSTSDRDYLWIERDDGVAKGVRIQEGHMSLLETLVRGEPVSLAVAPRVSGSTTYWTWKVEQDGVVLIDAEDSLR